MRTISALTGLSAQLTGAGRPDLVYFGRRGSFVKIEARTENGKTRQCTQLTLNYRLKNLVSVLIYNLYIRYKYCSLSGDNSITSGRRHPLANCLGPCVSAGGYFIIMYKAHDKMMPNIMRHETPIAMPPTSRAWLLTNSVMRS